MEQLTQIYDCILEGDMAGTSEAVQAAIDAGLPAGQIMNEGMIAAMAEVGRLFEEGEYFVPEMLIAARAMKAGLALIQPLLVDSGIEPAGKIAVGTVKGDLHDIGKNIVVTMMQGSGFEVVDLGVDCPAEKFITAVENGAQIIGMSAILTTTLNQMDRVIRLLEEKGLRKQVKILVGGASVTEQFANDIGADGYCDDAGSGVIMSRQFMEEKGKAW